MTLSRPASPASTPDAASAGGTGNHPASTVDSVDSASTVGGTGAGRVSIVDGACLAATPARSLWHDSEFVRFWLSQTTSMAGSQISFLALPLVAVLVLGAGAMQTGALTASSRLPFLVFGLLVGVWVDRFRRRPLIIWAYLGRAVVLAWIPAAAGLHVLTVEQIYVVAFAVGIPLLPVYGWLGTAGSLPPFFAVLLPIAVLAGAALAIANARADLEVDLAAGTRSVATTLGSSRSWWAGVALVIAATVIGAVGTQPSGWPSLPAALIVVGTVIVLGGLALGRGEGTGARRRP